MLSTLPSPGISTIIIRVRYFPGSQYLATVPNQGVFRSCSVIQGFEPAARALLVRHFPGVAGDPVEIPSTDERVQALNLKADRHDHDAKETRFFIAAIETLD